MRGLVLASAMLLVGCGEAQKQAEPSAQEATKEATAPSMPVAPEPENSFFPLASANAASVAKCRAAALAFDSNRRLEMAEKVVASCEADADAGKGGRECTLYAVRVSSAAASFVHQMKMIEADNPAWQGMAAQIKDHNERAREHARKCAT